MPRGSVHKRCPYCQRYQTKRHDIRVVKRVTLQGVALKGIQRWYCKECRRAFIPARPVPDTGKYTPEVYEQVAFLYFDQGASYRGVARDLRRLGLPGISAKRCWKMVHTLGAQARAPWQVSLDLKPQWGGYLAVDGDSLKVGHHRESALLGVDIETLDLPHLILAEHEDLENWLWFFLVLTHTLGYPLRGVVSDGDPAIDSVVALLCPSIPHQLCLRHFQRTLHHYLRYQSTHGRGTWREIKRFEEAVEDCIYAQTMAEAQLRFAALQNDPGFRRIHLDDAIYLLRRNFHKLTQHFLHPGLPRTNNVAEGTIRKLDRRLVAMDSFATHQTAWNILKMLTLHTRFRTLTDCRIPYRHRNGFSPLQLAGIDTGSLNWIQFGQQPPRTRSNTPL